MNSSCSFLRLFGSCRYKIIFRHNKITRPTSFVVRKNPQKSDDTSDTQPRFFGYTLLLKSDRSVLKTTFSCNAGKGFCKHAAALCIYVNVENTYSKTNEPMIWNRPSAVQLEKYSKGCRMEELFPPKKVSVIPKINKNLPDMADNYHMFNESPLTGMILAEQQCMEQREERENRRKSQRILGLLVFFSKYYRFRYISHLSYHITRQIVQPPDTSDPGKLITCFQEIQFKNIISQGFSLIKVDEEKWKQICFDSVSQSESAAWHSERCIRVTCSSKAHDIKTRQKNYHELALRYRRDKYKGRATVDMMYGLRMEPIARSHFEMQTGAKVLLVGFVVSLKQPFLACSPDGLIENNGTLELVEFKCPSSCQNDMIIDLENKTSRVKYLKFDGEKLILSDSHKYYTQVQVSMYILGIRLYHFVVYSSKDFAHIIVKRDEHFLRMVIPEIEHFHYEYFLPLLPIPAKNSGENNV